MPLFPEEYASVREDLSFGKVGNSLKGAGKAVGNAGKTAGTSIGKAGKTAGGAIGKAGKAVGRTAKKLAGGIWNLLKRWKLILVLIVTCFACSALYPLVAPMLALGRLGGSVTSSLATSFSSPASSSMSPAFFSNTTTASGLSF